MQLDALTTVMKVKALLYIMRGMNTCGTEIHHPYKQSMIGHYYRAELYFMQFNNQNICMCVCEYLCVSIWETEQVGTQVSNQENTQKEKRQQ